MPGGRFRLIPLYDVMSAQPNVDWAQIQQSRIKLAMAVGRSRHYLIDSLAPRHFVETAASAGVAPGRVQAIFDEIAAAADRAIEAACAELPPGFPESIVASVIEAVRRRLGVLTQVGG